MFNTLKTILKFSFIFIFISCANDKREKDNDEIDDLGDDNSSISNPINDNEAKELSTLNFYLENSGSMFPYTNGSTDFKLAVVNLLRNIELRNLDTINLFAVNTEIYPLNQNIDNFIKSFNNSGIPRIGNTNDSDLNKIFENVLGNHSDDAISILITDAIYSVKGTKEQILHNLETEVFKTRNEFIKTLRNKNLGTLCLKLSSNYKGSYYPAVGGSIAIDQERPYYIWIFGNNNLLKDFYTKTKVFDLPGYTDNFFSLKNEEAKIDYSIIEYGEFKIGDFNKENRNYPIHSINRSKRSTRPDTRNQFGFAVAIDFSNVPLPDQNLLDKNNFKISSDEYFIYDIKKIHPNTEERTLKSIADIEDKAGANFTHIILLKTETKHIQSFDIELHNKIPNWVELTGSDDDTNIKGDIFSTFGFNRLSKGITDAYNEINKSTKILSITLNVK